LRKPTFTIFLVDDNEVIQETCGRVLEQHGFRVVVAEDGDWALRKLDEVNPDLVLLDVMMPGLNGFEVLEVLRERYPPDELPVIMATAKDQNADVIRAFELGANDYVTKPLDFPVLLVRIRAQLRSRRKEERGRRKRRRLEADELRIEPGTVLQGKYRLGSLIGQGSYGVVYRGRHLALERQVAVKLLASEAGARSDMVQRFRQEGISACRIDHPNAVSVIDSSVTTLGIPYLVMELLEGHSLEEELKRHGRLSPRRCGEIVLPVCDVLSEAHSLGIIHRDVKPQNVFLHRSRQQEVVKVLDFGIAKLVGEPVADHELTPDEGVLGTPIYMAPERFTGEDYSGAADVYSLGVMLYEMLAGELPFGEPPRNPVKMIMLHMNEPPRPLLELCPELPAALGELVDETLAKDAEARPTAAELARRLASILELDLPPILAVERGQHRAGAGSSASPK
jgi:serine/threonine protein kinase